MYRVEISLENRRESVNFFSLWTANQKAKEYASCLDVVGVIIVDLNTAEIMISYEYGKLVWVSDIGEIK